MPKLAVPCVVVVCAGCLDPQVSDEVVQPSLILPAGAAVPSLYDGDEGDRIRASQGVSGTVPLYGGFVDGNRVQFYDFGPVPDHASPIFRLVDGAGAFIDHPPIFTAVPGDPGDSPYRTVFTVEVSASYAGELITSQAALNAAQTAGLLGAPKAAPQNLDWPVVTPDILIDVGGGQTAAAAHVFYYEGKQGVYLNFGSSKLAADNVSVPETALYELRREGGEPLSEPERHVDLDGDGDDSDTNDIFGTAAGVTLWSPRCRVVGVTVPADTGSFDTSKNQGQVELAAAADLFTAAGAPVAGTVLGIANTDRVFNCPQLLAGGN